MRVDGPQLLELVRLGSAVSVLGVLVLTTSPEVVGQVVTATAIASMASPVATLGIEHRLNDRQNSRREIRTLTSVGSKAALVGSLILGIALSSVSSGLVAAYAASELLLQSAGRLQSASHAKRRNESGMHALALSIVLARTASVATLIGLGPSWFAAASLATAAVLCLQTTRKDGRLFAELRRPGTINLSLIGAAAAAQDSADKVVVAAIAGDAAVAVYGLSYRIANVVYLPVRARLVRTYPQYFERIGADLLAFRHNEARRLAVLAMFGAIATIPAGAAVSVIAAAEYGSVPLVAPLVALGLVARATYYPAANSLVASGSAGSRLAIGAATTAMNVLANAALIWIFGWWVAIPITIATEVLASVLAWIVLRRVER